MREVIWIVFSTLYWGGFAVVLGLILRYAIRRHREVKALSAAGYVCIGCNFITGPIMVPPEWVLPPEAAKRRRELAKENQP